ncbi:BQ2448_3011 [Microbotryum intermedium]|uniref:BQ2448_3011 protein n=1 Tax=Microbotryum intermedium TaxID=269621 RepID=A0A238FHE2_9BASI|nr:BQ2448_3011 [Microbotryum intermedium]
MAIASVQRLLLVSAMIVSLSSGTNYIYSLYAPQLASRLHLNSKQLNIIGASGNAGVYLSGPFLGIIVDRKGPRLPLFLAAICLLVGYSYVKAIYAGGDSGLFASLGITGLALAELATGIGSSAGLSSAVNGTSKAFSPQRRGSSIAAVVSCFGLSAFFYSTLSHASFLTSSTDPTSSFLTVLVVGCTSSMLLGTLFIRNGVVPAVSRQNDYLPIDGISAPIPVPSFDEHPNAATSHRSISPVQLDDSSSSSGDEYESSTDEPTIVGRRSALGSSRSRSRSRSRSPRTGKHGRDPAMVDTDFRTLLSTLDFWLCFTYLGLCAGIGLMCSSWAVINNIGTQVATFLISEKPRTVAASQAHLVSLLSICNCVGRLAAGFSADFFTHHVALEYRFQRIWWYGESVQSAVLLQSRTTVPTASLFVISQLFARGADGVESLLLPTALTGFAYGAMFALSPIVCLERFGVRSFATNNGLLTLAPSVFGNLLNGLFGILYDANVDHSKGHDDSESGLGSGSTSHLLSRSLGLVMRAGGEVDHSHLCLLGKECFRAAFNASALMAVAALVVGFTLARRRSMHCSLGKMISNVYLSDRSLKIRSKAIPWEGYQRAGLLSQDDVALIQRVAGGKAQAESTLQAVSRLLSMLARSNTAARYPAIMRSLRIYSSHCPIQEADTYADLYVRLLSKLSRNDTLQYILVLVADFLNDKDDRIPLFLSQSDPYSPLLKHLDSQDDFVRSKSAAVISTVISGDPNPPDAVVTKVLAALSALIRNPADSEAQDVGVQCLGSALRIEKVRTAAWQADAKEGAETSKTIEGSVEEVELRTNPSAQMQYQLGFCFWLLTFDTPIAEQINARYNIIPLLADLARQALKEKVIRIVVAAFRNLVTKAPAENLPAMLVAKLLPFVKTLASRKWSDDEIKEDVEFLVEELTKSFEELTTFDEYKSEVQSGQLSWTPPHKNDDFWRDNAAKLNDKDRELLKALVNVLTTAKDPLVLAVAANDIAQYVKFCDTGKKSLDSLGAKGRVMELMNHADPDVKYYGLLATQRLISHAWAA